MVSIVIRNFYHMASTLKDSSQSKTAAGLQCFHVIGSENEGEAKGTFPNESAPWSRTQHSHLYYPQLTHMATNSCTGSWEISLSLAHHGPK